MKKSLFKLILGISAIVILFTSCLGDSNNEFGSDNVFAYITTHEKTGKKVAALSQAIYISSSTIDGLESGKCYLMSYRLSSDNLASNGIYENATITGISKSITPTMSIVGPVTTEDTFNPSDFIPYYGRSDSFMENNWGFLYTTAKLKENDIPRAYFFYDADRQYEMEEGVRKDVGKNQIIIDVRFNYVPGADGGSVLKQQVLSVGNLSRIRQEYRGSDNFEFGSDTYVNVAIRFRYNQLQPDDVTVKTDVYVGSWTSTPYNFTYYKDEEL
ncbi:MAG: hypothetical protein ACK5M3_01930 [Dysgonomonas sp.]